MLFVTGVNWIGVTAFKCIETCFLLKGCQLYLNDRSVSSFLFLVKNESNVVPWYQKSVPRLIYGFFFTYHLKFISFSLHFLFSRYDVFPKIHFLILKMYINTFLSRLQQFPVYVILYSFISLQCSSCITTITNSRCSRVLVCFGFLYWLHFISIAADTFTSQI